MRFQLSGRDEETVVCDRRCTKAEGLFNVQDESGDESDVPGFEPAEAGESAKSDGLEGTLKSSPKP